MLHDNKEKVSGELMQKFERLCTTTNQVRSIVHHLSAVNETVFKGITKARSHASEVTKRMRGIRTYSDAFKRIAPYPASSTPTHKLSIENNAAEQRAKYASARSEKVESLSRNAMEIIDKINDISAFELSAIQTRLHKLGKELRAINRTSGGQSERGCGSEVGHKTLYSLLEVSRVVEEVSNNLNTEDAKKNWTAITSNFTVLQQTVTSIEENVKETEGALGAIEDVRKNVASVVTSELESVRTSLCEARRKLGSATAYHVSMNQRFAKADEGVGEVQKQTTAVQKLVKQVRSDAESYRHAEKTATGAVEESKQACLKAEESAAEGDDEAQWAVKEACEAAKSVALERERVAGEMHRMREADRSAANYAADALRVRLNADAAKKTAAEARANIEELLKRVDGQINEVEKRFNDTVASLENLDFTHAPTACANTGITAPSDSIEDLAGAVVNFRQFVAETTDKNFSVIASTLKESEKRMRNELEGVRKAAEGAKSMLVRATAIRELSRAQRGTTRTALRRAKKALREAQEAADRAASGCLPLHKQVLRILTHLS
ncbi:hypothetical protein ERJ75_000156800 [Trypanosoma vivax]|uniref:Uncharacterized protein n=1 Tax=Trypanosoma vivax (strain Y486) TaxID=1055687 RepID=F9WRJ1_TRYVY|nr:hypothetical protein ERJ75_000156800 [Trypanosoma vivax]CCD20175.1 hypothetical protein, conserved in T. vivax [Trypanosoma vivax Y486]|eukprot:CCD20175.1 hypothetical protein, conserved in T. vivax [Trypanosoma vivax Y486]